MKLAWKNSLVIGNKTIANIQNQSEFYFTPSSVILPPDNLGISPLPIKWLYTYQKMVLSKVSELIWHVQRPKWPKLEILHSIQTLSYNFLGQF
jgi:hypothetical protein